MHKHQNTPSKRYKSHAKLLTMAVFHHLLTFSTSPTAELSLLQSLNHSFHCATTICSIQNSQSVTRRALLRALPLLTFSMLPQFANSRCLPPAEAESSLREPFPERWPYSEYDFVRYNKAPDAEFYAEPRITRHIDNGAVNALSAYYASHLLPSATDVLDLCCSVESYMKQSPKFRVVGLGMNEVEMSRNPALASFTVHDLNLDPHLPYTTKSFDLVLCALSIDYLTHPREVLREICRVLRPGGRVAISFSDRVFATKAVALWMSGNDIDHIYTVASFIHFAGGFGRPEVVDLSPRRFKGCTGDPLYVVTASKMA